MTYGIIAVRENPKYANQAAAYFSAAFGLPQRLYDDSIAHSLTTDSALPRWYLMLKGESVVGCYGLITNDFNSRQDLCPWLAALFVDETERGRGLGSNLLEHALSEAGKLGFPTVYLTTDLIGYYEKYGWKHIGSAYGITNESRVYAHETLRVAEHITITPIDEQLRERVLPVVEKTWGTPIVVNGRVYDCTKLPGIAALDNYGGLTGYLLYEFHGGVCEIMVLESVRQNVGSGTALITAVKAIARDADVSKVVVMTSNDNIHAIRFYQRRGFTLLELHRNAMDVSRKLKPQIPLIGENDIPIRDEIEFEIDV
jgi:GNAT superfamily N-acetyltransferase